MHYKKLLEDVICQYYNNKMKDHPYIIHYFLWQKLEIVYFIMLSPNFTLV